MFLTKSFVAPQVEVVPVKRIQAVLEMKPLDYKDMGPCGGFSTQYACYCDYYNMPYREEVAWDVDTIYFSHDTRELALTDFEHLDQRDLICIIRNVNTDISILLHKTNVCRELF